MAVTAVDATEAAVPLRKPVLTARKSSHRFQRQPVGDSTKSQKKKQSTKSTLKLKKNYATSTAWVTPQTKTPARVITKSNSPRKTKTSPFKPETATIPISSR